MESDLRPVDITHMPDLARLTDEVRATNRPLALQRNHEIVAVIIPAKQATRSRQTTKPSEAALQAFLSSAGSWKGIVDTEQLKRNIRESSRLPSRPPAKL